LIRETEKTKWDIKTNVMYRVLEINTKENLEQIICPNGTLEQVKIRINTMNKFNKAFGVKNRKYKPIKV